MYIYIYIYAWSDIMYINMCVCVCLKSINNINYSNIYYMLTGFVSKGKNMIKLL